MDREQAIQRANERAAILGGRFAVYAFGTLYHNGPYHPGIPGCIYVTVAA